MLPHWLMFKVFLATFRDLLSIRQNFAPILANFYTNFRQFFGRWARLVKMSKYWTQNSTIWSHWTKENHRDCSINLQSRKKSLILSIGCTCSLCLYYNIYVYSRISMFIVQSLCLNNNLYVYTTISMFILQSICLNYNLYVYTTISMFIEQCLCLNYNLYVYRTISMCILQSPCLYYLQSLCL